MVKILLLISLLAYENPTKNANQNLVINGGFEYSNSETKSIGIDSLKKYYWAYLDNYDTATLNSINVCHTKIVDWFTSVAPCTDWGYSMPYEGNGFAVTNSYDEYFECRGYLTGSLATTLEKGKKYIASFYIKKSPYAGHMVDSYGVSFVNNNNIFKYVRLNKGLKCLNYIKVYVEQTLKPNSYNDWVKVEGTFVADGDESKILIGSFRKDNEMTITKNKIIYKSDSCKFPAKYTELNATVFIDNVCVLKAE